MAGVPDATYRQLLSVALAVILVLAIYVPIHMPFPQAMAITMVITNQTTCEALPEDVSPEWIEPDTCQIDTGLLLVDDGDILRVHRSVLLEITSDSGIQLNAGATLDNDGNITNAGDLGVDTGATLNNGGFFTNHGTIFNSGTIDNDGTFDNFGAIENECDLGVIIGTISQNQPEDGCDSEDPESGSISGFKFDDEDGDGEWDTGEGGSEGTIGGVTICAFGDGMESAVCDVTDQETGEYLLEDLPLDIELEVYEEVPEGYEQTAPEDFEEESLSASGGSYFITLDSAEPVDGLNFGNMIIDVIPPAAPAITSPVDGAIINNSMPDIEGTAEANSTVEVFAEFEENVTSLGTTGADHLGDWQLSVSSALADGIHTFTATATDEVDNESPVSDETTVTIDTALPSTPVLIAPVNNANMGDNTTTFEWSEAEDATAVTYELFVDNDPDFSSIEELQSEIDDLTFTFDEALQDGTYHWRVRAMDEAGNTGAFSSVFTFTIDTIGPLSVVPATESGPVDFVLEGGELESIAAIGESDLPDIESKPENVDFPFGFFSWTVTGLEPGETITMTLAYPSDVPAGSSYWKVIGDEWIDASSLLGSNDGDETVTLTITDGGFGDADGQVNGKVSDPGGIGEGSGDLVIRKIKLGEPEVLLGGSEFTITPDPFTLESESSLTVSDNDENDSDPEDGIIEINDVGFATYTLVEATTPDGYERVVTSVTIVVNSGNLSPVVTVENRLAEEEIEQVVEVPPPQLDEEQVDDLGDKGAKINGQAVNSTNLPPALITPQNQQPQVPDPVIFDTQTPAGTNGGGLFNSYNIPTYPAPDESIANETTYSPPAFVVPKDDGSSFVLSPVIEEVFENMTMLLTPPEDTEVESASIQSVEIEFGGMGSGIGFSFDLSADIPEDLPNIDGIEETALFLDVDFVGNVNFSNPDSFASPPEFVMLVSRTLEGDQLPDGCPDIELYLLNENTNEWEELETPDRNPAGDTADECSYIVHTQHFSKFGIGSVKGTITTVSSRGAGSGGDSSRSVSVDGTFNEEYFAVNPLSKIRITVSNIIAPDGQADSTFAAGQQVTFSNTIRNYQQDPQSYVFIVQVIDNEGITQSLSYQAGVLNRAQELEVGQSWLAGKTGDYQVKMYVWSSWNAPDPLSDVTVKTLKVTEIGPSESA